MNFYLIHSSLKLKDNQECMNFSFIPFSLNMYDNFLIAIFFKSKSKNNQECMDFSLRPFSLKVKENQESMIIS